MSGWRTMSNISVEIAAQLAQGHRVVYAYYDGIDKVAHERGFGVYYDAELRMVDRMVGDVLDALPAGAVLLVTADHGQVDVGPRVLPPAPPVLAATKYQSGEGRFRWLHAKHGAAAELLDAATAAHSDVAWVVSKIELENSGFSAAHLVGGLMNGWRTMSNISVEIAAQLAQGHRVVYAYYDGIDKVAHERGFGPYYDAELRMVDRMVGDVLDALPAGAVLLVTADHGQVDVGPRVLPPAPEVLAATKYQSGEGRFRWLHAKPGAAADLLNVATAAHSDVAWVVSKEQILEAGWFGPAMAGPVASRLGDVALVARDPISFDDPADSGPFQLVCRHGSLTSAEMLVPLIAGRR
jgi:hypothetical protein